MPAIPTSPCARAPVSAANSMDLPELCRPTIPTSNGSTVRRNDAESINRNLDDTLWLGRAHSVGHERQTLNLLGYALMTNSLARSRGRPRIEQAA